MDRLEEIQARCKALADKLLYFVAGGYTTQDTLRSLCKDAAFDIGDLQREIACRDAEIEKLTALAQNGQSAIDTNKRLAEEVGRLTEIRDRYAQAARTIALYLSDYRVGNLTYDEMIAEAARKAVADIRRLKAENKRLIEIKILWNMYGGAEGIQSLRMENERLSEDISCTDKCDVCRNSFSNEKYYDEGVQEYYPRRFKCDSCYLGGGEQNNFEWRGLEDLR